MVTLCYRLGNKKTLISVNLLPLLGKIYRLAVLFYPGIRGIAAINGNRPSYLLLTGNITVTYLLWITIYYSMRMTIADCDTPLAMNTGQGMVNGQD